MRTSDTIGAFFLQTELHAGLTFASIALQRTSRPDKVARNTYNARLAYDTLLRFKDGVVLTPAAFQKFQAGITCLEQRLRQLGETL